jgi:alpha-tubulin suppressor-like RCC1 family protein
MDNAHSCAINDRANLYCWGDNRWFQLGDGTDTWRSTPVRVAVADARIVRTSANHTCAIDARNRVWCFGANSSGQLGRGTMTDSERTPAMVPSSNAYAVDLALSNGQTCALRVDGTVYCWGWVYGLVTGGTEYYRPTPVKVSGIDDAVAIGGGDSGFCVVRAAGNVTCHGGGLPAAPDVNDAVDVTVGESALCVLRANGMVRCFGNDYMGQAGGTGDILSDVRKVDMGMYFACALRTDGRIFCWGRDNYGELCSSATSVFSRTPVPINSSERFVDLSAGTQVACGTTESGVAKCWGNTIMVGDGSTSPAAASSPRTVALP